MSLRIFFDFESTVLTAVCYWPSSPVFMFRSLCSLLSSELNHNRSPWMLDPDRGVCQARNWGICPSENLKTLLSNFDICRQFQRIKMKFYILIVKIFRNAVCVRFDFVSCLSSEEDNLHRLSQRQQ